MKIGNKYKLSLFTMALYILTGAGSNAEDELTKGFQRPPDSAKPHTWWHWVNDNITKEGITADLEAMKRVGIGGAQIFNVDCGIPSGQVKFMSEQWREMIKHAAKEAERLGLELCVHNCAGWSSSGGPWIKPEHAMQMVITRELVVKGPTSFSDILPKPERPQPQGRWGFSGDISSTFYKDIAVLAFRSPKVKVRIEGLQGKAGYVRADNIQPSPSIAVPPEGVVKKDDIIDITDRLQEDGRLVWDVPEGEWTILRIGHVPTGKANHPATPEGRGFECDKLSREALDAHWAGMLKTIISDIGPLAGKVLNNVLIDSYEVGNQNWTPQLPKEFERRRGYSPIPYLPVLAGYVVDSPEISERFLWDMRRTLAELFSENYSGYFSELCHKYGMKLSIEPYGNGPFEDITYGGYADIPMGEFWVGGGARETCKLAASIGHVYGRRVIGAESFTATPDRGRWQNDPYSLKALGDLIYCMGVNRFIFHRYAHQPWIDVKPGMTMGPWGFHFERTITWWEQGRAWLDYLSRCQYLLQQGLFVGDVCYFVGEHAPNSAPFRSDLKSRGYDYDSCNADVILRRMSVRDGKLVLPDGMSYRVLVLPESEFMTPKLLRKIRELVRDGATVIGPKPRKSPSLSDYPKCDEEVKAIADEVWGDCDGKTVKEHKFGKGKVIWGKSVEDVLADMGVKPDFEYSPGTARLEFIHRVVGDVDIYFVSNQRYRFEEVECTFRVSGKVPELWHPDTGKIERVPIYSERDGRTTVPLRFEPAGSIFVVFRGKAPADHIISAKRSGVPEPRPSAPKLEIRRAIYEAVDGAGFADVTERVAAMVRNNSLSFNVNNQVLGGDPTPLHYKRLRVEYLLDGKPYTIVVNEGQDLEIPAPTEASEYPPFELIMKSDMKAEMRAWQEGSYEIKTAKGGFTRVEVSGLPKPLEIGGPWTVRFPPNLGAPQEISLDKLISWTEHSDPGVRYFSGTATYIKEFEVPAELLKPNRVIYLDLGRVKNICEVKVNGKDLGILWKPAFGVDITDLVRAGKNLLEVRVTNLWVNRLIGDEQFPDDCEWRGNALAKFPDWFLEKKPRPVKERITFTTWKHYTKDSPLLESGLLGPVTIRVAEKVGIDLGSLRK